MLKQPAVYMLASAERGTLYIGVTSDLPGRIYQHKHDLADGFTKRYKVHTLVWYELHGTMDSAIVREKQIKEWKRAWKLELVEQFNPEWADLYERSCENPGHDPPSPLLVIPAKAGIHLALRCSAARRGQQRQNGSRLSPG